MDPSVALNYRKGSSRISFLSSTSSIAGISIKSINEIKSFDLLFSSMKMKSCSLNLSSGEEENRNEKINNMLPPTPTPANDPRKSSSANYENCVQKMDKNSLINENTSSTSI